MDRRYLWILVLCIFNIVQFWNSWINLHEYIYSTWKNGKFFARKKEKVSWTHSYHSVNCWLVVWFVHSIPFLNLIIGCFGANCCLWKMSENIGNLYVRAESEEEVSVASSSPRKSTSLSSLRNLRDTFKRSESRTSQTSLVSASKSESLDNGSDTISPIAKASECWK